MQTSCCDDDCPVKNEIDPVNPQPCSKHCACYLSQAVADLKTNITVRIYSILLYHKIQTDNHNSPANTAIYDLLNSINACVERAFSSFIHAFILRHFQNKVLSVLINSAFSEK